MPFIDSILQHRSLSIVGLEKNTGKTVCLNYVLRRMEEEGIKVGVTSIGVDGEQSDSVYATSKPEITLYEGTHFITSERHYGQRQLVSQVLYVDSQRTSLGRMVTGEVLIGGKIMLSGAASTEKLRKQIQGFDSMGVRLTIVDGALSRLSLASPTITDAMILATGAAVSPNLQQLVSKTRFVCRLIRLPEVSEALRKRLMTIESGLWNIDDEDCPYDTGITSVFLLDRKSDQQLLSHGQRLFVAGAVSDRLLKYLVAQQKADGTTLIARDFTKFFFSQDTYADYHRNGGRLAVLQQSNLIAICLNPTSPQGYRLNSEEACQVLSEAMEMPVYDIVGQTQTRTRP